MISEDPHGRHVVILNVRKRLLCLVAKLPHELGFFSRILAHSQDFITLVSWMIALVQIQDGFWPCPALRRFS